MTQFDWPLGTIFTSFNIEDWSCLPHLYPKISNELQCLYSVARNTITKSDHAFGHLYVAILIVKANWPGAHETRGIDIFTGPVAVHANICIQVQRQINENDELMSRLCQVANPLGARSARLQRVYHRWIDYSLERCLFLEQRQAPANLLGHYCRW
jgi:hypothetical protein